MSTLIVELSDTQLHKLERLADGHRTPPGFTDRRGTLCDKQFCAR